MSKYKQVEVADKHNPVKIHAFRFHADGYISYNQFIKGNPFYTCWTRVYKMGFCYNEYLIIAIGLYNDYKESKTHDTIHIQINKEG